MRRFVFVVAAFMSLTGMVHGGPAMEHGLQLPLNDDYSSLGFDVRACYGLEPISGMKKPDDCPEKMTVQGFSVYVSEHVRREGDIHVEGQENGLTKYLNLLDGVLFELEQSERFPSTFVRFLREVGVVFNISARWYDVDRKEIRRGPYNFCGDYGGCYLGEWDDGVVMIDLPNDFFNSYHTWRSMRPTIVHELAHAYHDLGMVGGFENQCINDAYRFSVLRDGKHENFYATTNSSEYFAEVVTSATYSFPLVLRDTYMEWGMVYLEALTDKDRAPELANLLLTLSDEDADLVVSELIEAKIESVLSLYPETSGRREQLERDLEKAISDNNFDAAREILVVLEYEENEEDLNLSRYDHAVEPLLYFQERFQGWLDYVKRVKEMPFEKYKHPLERSEDEWWSGSPRFFFYVPFLSLYDENAAGLVDWLVIRNSSRLLKPVYSPSGSWTGEYESVKNAVDCFPWEPN